jgi:hypothetical protein
MSNTVCPHDDQVDLSVFHQPPGHIIADNSNADTCLNQRLSPQLVATDRDIDNFVSFLRAFEELGVYHIQFNVISSDALRRRMITIGTLISNK